MIITIFMCAEDEIIQNGLVKLNLIFVMTRRRDKMSNLFVAFQLQMMPYRIDHLNHHCCNSTQRRSVHNAKKG